MKNLIKVSVLVTFLFIIPFDSFSQDQYRNTRDNTVKSIPFNSYSYQDNSSKNYFAIQVGHGISYGGTGIMAFLKISEDISIMAAIGQYSGPPLAFEPDGQKLSKETQTGLGYAIGIKIHPNKEGFYSSIQYISAGKYKDEYTAEMELTGLNWTMIGGNHSIAKSHFFFDWGFNIAWLFSKEPSTGMLGLSLGLGYKF